MNTPLPALAPRLFAGVGLLALLGAVGLTSLRPAHGTGGPVPVAVTNAPLAVITTDPVIAQPYAQHFFLDFSKGDSTAASESPAVPAGKRLVVQTVSLYRNGPTALGSVSQAFISAAQGGRSNNFALPSVATSGVRFPAASQALTFQADGGTTLVITDYRSGATDGETDVVTVSGYLVNVP